MCLFVYLFVRFVSKFLLTFDFMQEELLQMKTIEKSLAVFALATYGEGDPTDNAMEFWEWIQGDVDLSGLNYAVSISILRVFESKFETISFISRK